MNYTDAKSSPGAPGLAITIGQRGYADNADSVAVSARLSSVQVSELMTRSPLSVGFEHSIREAAATMHKHRISCLPVIDSGVLVGMVTEADFVGRVVADGRNSADSIKEVMTHQPLIVRPDQSVLDVLTLMTRYRINHMPVCTGAEPQLVGIVTQTDVIRHQIASSIFMVSEIARATSSTDIAKIVEQVPRLMCSVIDNGGTTYETGRIITSITGATTRRLLELAEDQLGPAPVPYVWLACGSQGRQEQTSATDQDNCLILDDSYDSAKHGEYFAELATQVCAGLDEAGYVFCPGDMMAKNEKWRQPVGIWREYFTDWISRPGTEAQMLASVMFDLRPIHGDETLYEPLRDDILHMAKSNSIFVAHMTSNSLTHQPALGMFSRFKTPRHGDHAGKIDLKHEGVVPIVDLARLYALSAEIKAVNTIDRLSSDADSDVLSRSGAATLLSAYQTIGKIRMEHQVAQIKNNQRPDNFLDPSILDSLERDRLRQAMKSVKGIQSALNSRVAVMGR